MKKLKASCSCGSVKFSFNSEHIYPYQRCYCSICRKTQGGGGFAINLSGEAESLKIKGKKNIKIYHSSKTGERNFCKKCGSGLWLFDKSWPELIHPFASAIDSELPIPKEKTHLMVEFKPKWVKLDRGEKDKVFKRYPKESIAQWHERINRE
jgi:hypothetical protein